MLNELFQLVRCPTCESPVTFENFYAGTSLHYTVTCAYYHVLRWKAQPLIGKLPAFNLLLSASIFFSGETFQRVRKPMEFAGLNFINPTTFYNIQRTLILPTINQQFKECIDTARQESKNIDKVILGDGRFDSPGKSAKYCTYTCQSPTTKKSLRVLLFKQLGVKVQLRSS